MKNRLQDFSQYVKENCGCESHSEEYLPQPIQSIDVCSQCGQFAEDCECKGKCANCGEENGGCDCSQKQDFEIGDMVRDVNPDCPHHQSTGRVIDMPKDDSIIYTVTQPTGNLSIGQLLNKSKNQLTIDQKYKI